MALIIIIYPCVFTDDTFKVPAQQWEVLKPLGQEQTLASAFKFQVNVRKAVHGVKSGWTARMLGVLEKLEDIASFTSCCYQVIDVDRVVYLAFPGHAVHWHYQC